MVAPVHAGGVALLLMNRPQSSTEIVRRLVRPGTAGVLVMFAAFSRNVPLMLPVFWMSTMPVRLSPGFIAGDAVKPATATPSPGLLLIDSVPAVNVLDGLALWAVKLAPEPI